MIKVGFRDKALGLYSQWNSLEDVASWAFAESSLGDRAVRLSPFESEEETLKALESRDSRFFTNLIGAQASGLTFNQCVAGMLNKALILGLHLPRYKSEHLSALSLWLITQEDLFCVKQQERH